MLPKLNVVGSIPTTRSNYIHEMSPFYGVAYFLRVTNRATIRLESIRMAPIAGRLFATSILDLTGIPTRA